jgi:hypothetical protein
MSLAWTGCQGRGLEFDDRRTETASEIARMIKERAYRLLGPWPADLQLIIFNTTFGWRCGLSPATQASGEAKYREAVLEIAKELQSTVSLVRPEGETQFSS